MNAAHISPYVFDAVELRRGLVRILGVNAAGPSWIAVTACSDADALACLSFIAQVLKQLQGTLVSFTGSNPRTAVETKQVRDNLRAAFELLAAHVERQTRRQQEYPVRVPGYSVELLRIRLAIREFHAQICELFGYGAVEMRALPEEFEHVPANIGGATDLELLAQVTPNCSFDSLKWARNFDRDMQAASQARPQPASPVPWYRKILNHFKPL